jgi:hypothetical protein
MLRTFSAFLLLPPLLSPSSHTSFFFAKMSLEKSILGMGNPLLDISAEVDDAFLAKYEVRKKNVFFIQRRPIELIGFFSLLLEAFNGRFGVPTKLFPFSFRYRVITLRSSSPQRMRKRP